MNDATPTTTEAPQKKSRRRAPKRSEEQQIRDLQARIAALEERKNFKSFAGTALGAKLRRAISNLEYVAKKTGDADLKQSCADCALALKAVVAARTAKPAEPALPGFE